MSTRHLLIKADTVKNRTGLYTNVDDKLIVPEIRVAQDLKLPQLLGEAYFAHLVEASRTNDLTEAETALLNDYVTDVLVWYAIAKICLTSTFQLSAKGVIQKNGESTSNADLVAVRRMQDEYEARAESYARALVEHLSENADDYPVYKAQSACSGTTRRPYRVATFLGPIRKRNCSR